MSVYAPMNRRALDAFDALAAGGMAEPVREANPFLACHVCEAGQKAMLKELRHVESAGQQVEYEALNGAEARELEPVLSEAVAAAVRLIKMDYYNTPLDNGETITRRAARNVGTSPSTWRALPNRGTATTCKRLPPPIQEAKTSRSGSVLWHLGCTPAAPAERRLPC